MSIEHQPLINREYNNNNNDNNNNNNKYNEKNQGDCKQKVK